METNPELTTTESEKKDAETESENEDSTAVSMENKEDFTPVFEVDSGDFYSETEVENKYFTMENKEDVTAVFEADSDYNLDLWRALVGNRSSLPKKDDLVVYFPQGHLEYAALITSSSFSSSEVPTFNLQPEIICSVQHVQLIANKMTDETCAHVILLPEQKLEGQNTKDEEVMKSGVNKARDRGRPEKAASQVFSVTLSKPKHLQTIWIPEYAYEVFPLRNLRFRTQLVSAEDVQGTEWMFCIKYADSRRKYQIRRGWTQFVTTKRLSLKDTVAFVRCGDRKLRLVIKRFGCECGVPMSILAKYYQCSSVLSPVADAILKGSPFNVFYCGRVGSADFIIPYQKYMESITRLGMIGAKFETMDALSQRCSGVVTGISELDPFNWPNSKWKCLMVSWDNAANKKPLKEAVSPWEIVLKVPSSSDSSIDISPKLKKPRTVRLLNISLPLHDPAGSGSVLFDDKLKERERQASVMGLEGFQRKINHVIDVIEQAPAPQTAFLKALSSDKLQRNSSPKAWEKLNTSLYDPAGSSFVLFDDKLEERGKQASGMVQEEFQQKEFPLKRIVDIIKQGPAPQTAFSEALSSDKLQRNSRSRAWNKLNTSFYDPAGSSFVLFDDKLEEREKQASVMVQEEFQRKEFPLKRIIDIIKQGRAPQIAFPKALSSDELQRNSRPRARKKRSGFDTDRDSSLASSKKRKSATIVTPTHLKISKRPDQELMICFERGVSRATHDKVSVDRIKPLQMQFSHAQQICESTAPFPDKGDVSSSIMTQPSSRLKRQRKLDSSPVDIETEGFLDELKSLEMQSPESKQVLPSTTPFPGKGDVSSSIMAQPSSRLKKELENSPLDSFRFTPLPGNCCLASLSESKSTTDVKQLKISNCSGHDVWFHLKGDHCFEYLEFDSCSFPSSTSLHIPIILKELKITNCLVTECVFTSLMDPKLSVESLEIDSCSSLHSISIDNIPASLRQLKIVNCMNLKSLSESIFESSKHHSVSLGPLNYSDSSKIDSIGTLELRKLVIQNCLELEYLPEDLHKLCNLDVLSIKNCCSLEYFPEGGLPKTCLRSLKISECENLKRLPNQLEEVTSLQKLSICGCSSLVSFQEGGLPPNLVSLRIINCENLFLDLSQWDLDKLTHLKLCSFIGGCPDS